MSTRIKAAFAAALVAATFPAPASARAQSSEVDVLFWISSYQINSYSAHILIANRSNADIDGWRLRFELDSPISFVNYALWTQTGSHVEIEGTGWTKWIPAGDSVWFNLSVRWNSEIHVPRDVSFNDLPITLVTNFDNDDGEGDGDDGGDGGDGGDGDDGGDDDGVGDGGVPGNVRVEFWYSSVWENGFVGWFSIKNVGSTPVRGWTLSFSYPHRITLIWNGRLAVDGRKHTVSDAGWNRSIAPGDSAWFGFQGEFAGVLRDPSGCVFNGGSCALNGIHNRDSQLVTGIEELESAGFSLDVFPNPDPRTIRFSVARSQHVRLELVDMTGRVVDRLFDTTLAGGEIASVALEPGRFAAGLYVVRLSGAFGTGAARAAALIR